MVRVEVKAPGRLGYRLKSQNLKVELPGESSTLADLIEALSHGQGAWIKDLLLDPDTGYLSGSLVISVDDRVVVRQRPEEIILKDGSVVWLIVVVDGG
ncbi:MAG: MoaD/ThiS family protein [Peptococcaceae bacterium]|nr:MoaD/ThiS family protein [Peptococcaceae bacterium]